MKNCLGVYLVNLVNICRGCAVCFVNLGLKTWFLRVTKQIAYPQGKYTKYTSTLKLWKRGGSGLPGLCFSSFLAVFTPFLVYWCTSMNLYEFNGCSLFRDFEIK